MTRGAWDAAHSFRGKAMRLAMGLAILMALTALPQGRSRSGRSDVPLPAGVLASSPLLPNMAQFLCNYDCRDSSFQCCNSEGACEVCFDFDVVPGRKELITDVIPDACESPPDSQGSFGICPIQMSICLALECLIEPPPPGR